jgi:hypothetical protein
MSKSRSSSTAYAGDRTIELAPLECPYCRYDLIAHEIEPLGDGEYRLICPACHRDLLSVERR